MSDDSRLLKALLAGPDSSGTFREFSFEIEEGVRSLGKTAVRNVSKDDMLTYDEEVAQITGIDLAFHRPILG